MYEISAKNMLDLIIEISGGKYVLTSVIYLMDKWQNAVDLGSFSSNINNKSNMLSSTFCIIHGKDLFCMYANRYNIPHYYTH